MKNNFAGAFLMLFLCVNFSFAQSDGMLDSTFSSDGIVVSSIGSYGDYAYAIAIQDDGKIVVAGTSNDGDYDRIAVSRYLSNGDLDITFNSNGIYFYPDDSDCEAFAVAVQADGKILVGGYTQGDGSTDFLLIRLTTSGILDSEFGSGGIFTYDYSSADDYINVIAIQPNGAILFAGGASVESTTYFALGRVTFTGELDPTFMSGNIQTTAVGLYNSEAYAIVIQSDGKIILGGGADQESDWDFALVRYLTDGSIDQAYGENGIVYTDIEAQSEKIYALALQDDGQLIACGYTNNDSDDDFVLIRYNVNGDVDYTFGDGGFVVSDFYGYDEVPFSVNIQSDSKIIASGFTYNGEIYQYALIRYSNDGEIDTTFGDVGFVTTSINDDDDAIYASALQADGKLVVAGGSYMSADFDFSLARYNTEFGAGMETLSSAQIDATLSPNPSKDFTRISYNLNESGKVTIQVYDIQGRLVKTVVSGQYQQAGKHELLIPTFPDLNPGSYLVKIQSEKGSNSMKLIQQ